MVAGLSSPLVQKNKQTFAAFNLLKILIKQLFFEWHENAEQTQASRTSWLSSLQKSVVLGGYF